MTVWRFGWLCKLREDTGFLLIESLESLQKSSPFVRDAL
jgi:hypothetical protein